MKTSNEIMKSLRIHGLSPRSGCVGCAYRNGSKIPGTCTAQLLKDTIIYIKQLEQERNAAVEDLAIIRDCKVCVHFGHNAYEEPCRSCGISQRNWMWRRVEEDEA